MRRPETPESLSPPERLEHAREQFTRRDPLWPEQLAVLVVILLSLTLPDELTVGPTWLLPAMEGVLLLGLVATTPRARAHETMGRRHVRIGLISLMSAGNVASLFFLARFGLGSHVNGHALLGGGIVLWFTAMILFAFWYWELDRGGPVLRDSDEHGRVDFVFPQMEMQDPRFAPDGWMPRLPDFLYLSFVNAVTFGPPESHVPLTDIAKLMMSVQAMGALITDTFIVARAVNLLG